MSQSRAGLSRYRAKREFTATAEPRGAVSSARGNRFVVQKHAARALHYDFRLEMDGVLKSWAVVKGPSLDPADKRLAVHVEDHPLDYSGFEGTIPQGHYGGGTVMIWDQGTWSPEGDPHEGYRKGHLKFTLAGRRMKGAWSLVRMGRGTAAKGKDNWLLIKSRDRHAKGGEGKALVERATKSVASGRTMEEIARGTGGAAAAPRGRQRKPGTGEVAGIVLSHADRVVFPDLGVTKRDLADYYRSVGEWIMPHIANRPLSLLRCPAGVGEKCFFQKHFPTGLKTLQRVPITERRGAGEYVVLRDVHDLVALVQEGIVEIHPWGARADNPDRPDRLIFDFDPDPKVAFAAVIDAARMMRDHLGALGLQSFVKTTGGKGLHVEASLRRGLDWKGVKEFARIVAADLVASDPAQFTVNPLKRERTGRIFIDYLRNDRGATAIAPYAVRARAGATVALPLDWRDLARGFDPARFTIATVPKLLARRKSDPWAQMVREPQTITGARRALGLAA